MSVFQRMKGLTPRFGDASSLWSAHQHDSDMDFKKALDLTATIKNGESGKIIVDMIAPDKPGLYSTNWTIASGSKILCSLSITVNVIAK